MGLSIVVMVLRTSQAQAQSLHHSLLLSSPVTRASWSPDGTWLAVSAYDGIRIYDANLQQVSPIIGEQVRWYSVEWRPDGQQFAASHGENGSTVIWEWDANSSQAQQLRVLPNLDSFVSSVGAFWSPDGTRMITIGLYTTPAEYYGVYQLWDTISGVRLGTLPFQASYFTPVVAWSPDGSQIAGGGVHRCPDSVPETQCQSNGQVLFVAEITNPNDVWFVPSPGEPDDFDWSQNAIAMTVGGTIQIYEPISRQRLITLETQQNDSLVWSPNGRYLATLGFNGTVDILEVTGSVYTLAGRFQTNKDSESTSLDWSVNNLISLTNSAGLIEIWDINALVGVVSPSSTHTQTATATAAPSPAALPSLREVFNAPTCAVSCWQGIEPNVTTRDSMITFLNQQRIQYSQRAVIEGVTFYGIYYNQPSPYLQYDDGISVIQAYVSDGIVRGLDIPISVTLQQVIAEYGAPAGFFSNPSLVGGFQGEVIFPSHGIYFYINAGSPSVTTLIRLMSPSEITRLYRGSISTIEDCNVWGQGQCFLSTATPTAPRP